MTAEIIDMWLARRGLPQRLPTSCMYEPKARRTLIDRSCPCAKCREFFAGAVRTSREIFQELGRLQMLGEADKPVREALYAELRVNSDPFHW